MRRADLSRLVPAALLLVASSCGDGPTTPGSLPLDRLVTSGQLLEGSVSPGAPATVRYAAARDEEFEVRFRALADSLALLRVRGTDTSVLLMPFPRRSDTLPMVVSLVAPSGGDTTRLVVQARGSRGGAFRLTVNGQRRAPESQPAALAFGALATDRIDAPNDVDVFELPPVDGSQPLIITARLLDAPAQGEPPITLSLVPRAGTGVASAGFTREIRVAAELDTTGGGPVALSAGTYDIVVRRPAGLLTNDDRVRYELRVRVVDPRPESGSATLALGDTLVGSVDFPGDVDEFTVSGAPFEAVQFALQATDVTDSVRLVRVPADGRPPLVARRGGTLLLAPQKRGVLGPDGVGRVRVDAAWPARGGYRVFPYRLDPRVEGRDSTFVPGQTITSRLDVPGDVDQFRAPAASGTLLILELSRPAGGGAGAIGVAKTDSSALGSSGGIVLVLPERDTDVPQRVRSAPVSVRGSSLRLAVVSNPNLSVDADGGILPGSYVGPYTLTTTILNPAPESRGAILAFGDTVRGERIDVPGDVDEFFVDVASHADTIALQLLATPRGVALPLQLQLRDPMGFPMWTWWGQPADDSVAGNPVWLRTPGRYGITVSGRTGGANDAEAMGYTLVVQRFTARVEHGLDTLALGDSLVGERLDFRGDVDGITLVAPAGAPVVLRARGVPAPNTGTRMFAAEVFAPDGRTLLRTLLFRDGSARSAEPFVMPDGGRARIRVLESECNAMLECSPLPALTGAYVLEAVAP